MLRKLRPFLYVTCLFIATDAGLVAASAASNTPAQPITADDYVHYRNDVAEISRMRLDDPSNIEKARQMLLGHNQLGLSRGFLLEMAEIAAQSDKFNAGVKKAMQKSGGAERFASRLQAHPEQVFEIGGWQQAAQDVARAQAQDASLMSNVSYRLNEVAYGRTGEEARLAREAQAGRSGITGSTPRIKDGSTTALMTQILALGAAQAAAGGSAPQGITAALSTNKDYDQCLRWSDLNLKQCLAAARDNSERAYCLSLEGVGSRNTCWSKAVTPGATSGS